MANPEHVEPLQRSVDEWNLWRMEHPDVVPDLVNVTLVEWELSGANLKEANLTGAILRGANLRGADLRGARLVVAELDRADLRGANLRGAHLGSTKLADADLEKADLSGATLIDAWMRNANLRGADLRFANLSYADICGAALDRAKLSAGENDTAATDFTMVRFDRKTSFANVKISLMDWSSNPPLKRHIEDQQFLAAVRQTHPVYHGLWRLTCDCGRSLWRWAAWSLGLAMLFGVLFRIHGDGFVLGDGRTLLSEAPFFTAFYYSIVTFTTLGFGDVTPKPAEAYLQFLVTIEVILGYVMLGGLISILSTKLARRA